MCALAEISHRTFLRWLISAKAPYYGEISPYLRRNFALFTAKVISEISPYFIRRKFWSIYGEISVCCPMVEGWTTCNITICSTSNWWWYHNKNHQCIICHTSRNDICNITSDINSNFISDITPRGVLCRRSQIRIVQLLQYIPTCAVDDWYGIRCPDLLPVVGSWCRVHPFCTQ